MLEMASRLCNRLSVRCVQQTRLIMKSGDLRCGRMMRKEAQEVAQTLQMLKIAVYRYTESFTRPNTKMYVKPGLRAVLAIRQQLKRIKTVLTIHNEIFITHFFHCDDRGNYVKSKRTQKMLKQRTPSGASPARKETNQERTFFSLNKPKTVYHLEAFRVAPFSVRTENSDQERRTD